MTPKFIVPSSRPGNSRIVADEGDPKPWLPKVAEPQKGTVTTLPPPQVVPPTAPAPSGPTPPAKPPVTTDAPPEERYAG